MTILHNVRMSEHTTQVHTWEAREIMLDDLDRLDLADAVSEHRENEIPQDFHIDIFPITFHLLEWREWSLCLISDTARLSQPFHRHAVVNDQVGIRSAVFPQLVRGTASVHLGMVNLDHVTVSAFYGRVGVHVS